MGPAMTRDASSGPAVPVGREHEVDALRRFAEGLPDGPAALVLEGEAGIGKTTLWWFGVDLARSLRFRILTVRPAEAEVRLSFAGLADLLEGADELIERLPGPMRNALAVALLREEPGADPTDARAVYAACAALLRAAGAEGPTLIAVDDAQWLDPASASALAFGLRRLGEEPIGCLVCVRERGAAIPFGVARTFAPSRVTRVPVPPLTRDRLDEMIRDRIGARLPPPVLDRLAETSAGNPFFALEIAAAAVRGDQRATGQSLPIPRDLRDDLIRDRLAGLAALGREALLFAAASSHPTTAFLAAALGRPADAQLARAIGAGLIEVDADAVRFAHPLYGSAIYAEASRDHRHRVHRRASEVVDDPEERARHLALASDGPDPDAAAALEQAAEAAQVRGAPASAAELYELAGRLTRQDRASEVRRLRTAAAAARARSGDLGAALEVLVPLAAEAEPGPERAAVLELLARVRRATGDLRGANGSFVDASNEDGVDDGLRAAILTGRSVTGLVLGDLAGAERDAREALRSARSAADDEAVSEASVALAGARAWLGHGVDLALIGSAVASDRRAPTRWSVGRASLGAAGLLARTGAIDDARSLCDRLLGEAQAAGDEPTAAALHRDLAWLDLLAGAWDRARDHIDRAIAGGPDPADALGPRAILSALRGRDAEAAADAEAALDAAGRTGAVETELLARSALGLVALPAGDAALAVSHLDPAWALLRSVGIGDPAMFPFVADLAEASIELGRHEEARAIVAWLDERGRAIERPWALGAAARGRGLLASAEGDPDRARVELEDAMRLHEALGMPFEIARTLLGLGGVLRRSRQKRASRDALERAAAMFGALGAPVWAERARAEAARIGGRRPPSGDGLTQAEERVARLAAGGMTNREIADALYMSVRTVEGHLSHIYRKLGVRSRTELAAYYEREDRSPDVPEDRSPNT
jgi:DNA-binding CsgD family transcriptional regulator